VPFGRTGDQEGCALAGRRVLLSIDEAAEVLSISRTSMFNHLRAGLIESIKLGHRRFVPADAIAAYITRLAQSETATNRRHAEGN
jgi:excisionase family DNA binding protein